MKETLERELKLSVERTFRLPELPGRALARRTLTSIYHDTPDFRLAQAGVTLRRRIENRKSVRQPHPPSPRDTPASRLAQAGVTLRRRIENRKSVWQLKLPRGAARLELEVPGGP